MKFFIILACLSFSLGEQALNFTENTEFFMLGLYNGLQQDQYSPSICVKSFPIITQAIESLEYSISIQDKFSVKLHAFQLIVNSLATTSSTCDFNALVVDIFSIFEISSLKELTIALLTNVFLYRYLIEGIVIAYINAMHYDEGYYLGKLLSTSFGYYL